MFTPLITAISLILGPTLHPEIVAAQDQLKSPSEIEKLSYDDAIARVNDIIAEENSTNDIRPECHSIMKDHGKKTDKAVVLIHGVSGCPAHFAELANKFYNEGYNVFIPRMPKHGLTDNNRHWQNLQVLPSRLLQSLVDWVKKQVLLDLLEVVVLQHGLLNTARVLLKNFSCSSPSMQPMINSKIP